MTITAPLSVRELGFSLHAATRAGADDEKGREALLKYMLRPPPVPSANDHAHAGAPDSCCPPPSCEKTGSRYRPWAELLKRTFGIDVHTCPRCGGRKRLLALITEPMNVARFLRHIGKPTEPPPRAPARDPPFWHSRMLRYRPDERCGQMGLFEEH